MAPPPVVLASSSPRRHQLLAQLGVEFEIIAADIDETPYPNEVPLRYVERLARQKAEAVAQGRPRSAVIAADTTVEVDGEILAKPEDADDARRMLELLSGRAHLVHTGVAIARDAQLVHGVSTTLVRFVVLSGADIDWYLSTGEPFDKAGAYALQGAGGVFVEHITGSVSNVVGLPLTLLVQLAERVSLRLPPQSSPNRSPGPHGR